MNETHSPLATGTSVTSGTSGTSGTSVTSGASATPPARRYRIDPQRSTIAITTRHLFGLGQVRATLALRDGRIQVNDPVAGSSVRASAVAVSFRSGNDTRDAAVLSPRLLDAATYPSLTFTSTALERESAPGATSDEHPRWLLRGELEVRGVGRLVETTIATVQADGGTLRASARLRVDRYAFGITAYRGLAARWLTVDIDIIAEADDQTAKQNKEDKQHKEEA